MIAYLKGILVYKDYETAVIDVNGVGYSVFISKMDYNSLELNKDIKIFTYMNVKEDEISLYGFLNKKDLDIFKLVVSVNNFGPKKVMQIFSSINVSEFIDAILNEKMSVLKTISGVGEKSAKRLIIELKDKFVKLTPNFVENKNSSNIIENSSVLVDAKDALLALGYTNIEINRVMKKISKDISNKDTVQNIIKLALKNMKK